MKSKVKESKNVESKTPVFAPVIGIEERKTEKLSFERMKTGVDGLDELLPEGIPRGFSILINGSSGSGKSCLSLQILYEGVVKFNEAGIYISFEESADSIRNTGKIFGMEIEKYEKENKLAIISKDPYEVKNFATSLSGELYYKIKDMNAKRLVVDSVTYLGGSLQNPYELRRLLNDLNKRLKTLGITTFFISETPESANIIGRYGVEEFVVDGVILLHNILVKQGRQRAVEILKMRQTAHDTSMHPFRITSRGVEIYPKEQVII
jgi:circadian clock protein KaiC